MKLSKSKKANVNYLTKIVDIDPEQTGMFEDNGRVKAIRLKNELSEGFILPVVQFQNYIMSVTNKEIEVEEVLNLIL